MPKSQKERRSRVRTITIPDALWRLVEQRSDGMSVPRAQVVRWALALYFNVGDKRTAPGAREGS